MKTKTLLWALLALAILGGSALSQEPESDYDILYVEDGQTLEWDSGWPNEPAWDNLAPWPYASLLDVKAVNIDGQAWVEEYGNPPSDYFLEFDDIFDVRTIKMVQVEYTYGWYYRGQWIEVTNTLTLVVIFE